MRVAFSPRTEGDFSDFAGRDSFFKDMYPQYASTLRRPRTMAGPGVSTDEAAFEAIRRLDVVLVTSDTSREGGMFAAILTVLNHCEAWRNTFDYIDDKHHSGQAELSKLGTLATAMKQLLETTWISRCRKSGTHSASKEIQDQTLNEAINEHFDYRYVPNDRECSRCRGSQENTKQVIGDRPPYHLAILGEVFENYGLTEQAEPLILKITNFIGHVRHVEYAAVCFIHKNLHGYSVSVVQDSVEWKVFECFNPAAKSVKMVHKEMINNRYGKAVLGVYRQVIGDQRVSGGGGAGWPGKIRPSRLGRKCHRRARLYSRGSCPS
ncbi:hypothetical protein BDZ85DRAFT_321572 [Elsinoe ampelina]|uniref:Uncharacterized protein n=1 Tax=Elsinoe ampelina TaxID=302913 RepID=A0A6A6G307_9PEZI|nr:hypothetical protein BDZ85DRAFT_321572 [Elsinoe ampelina]